MSRNAVSTFLDKHPPPEGLLSLTLSVILGACTGLGAVAFIHLIAFVQNTLFGIAEYLPALGRLAYMAVPVIGALLAGWLIANFAMEAKGHGVPEVMQALVIRGGRIRARVASAKILASALCIGSGGSAGREGPIIQVGAALGSFMGQSLQLSDERIKNMVACGAAAGIAATFNAPIAGVTFAIEVLMSEIGASMFGNVVISAVSASIVSQMFLGNHPAFSVPYYTMESSLSILLYLVLGLGSALVGVMFIRMLDKTERLFDQWSFPLVLKPAVGAVLLGIIGILYLFVPGTSPYPASAETGNALVDSMPHVYSSGFLFIEQTLRGEVNVWLLVCLVLLKPVATCCTLGSGNSGGVFAPSLFVGAMFGGAMGWLFNTWFPGIADAPGAYALVGMAAVFAACAHAPLTALLIVFEMSSDYSMILPLMVAAVTASNLARFLYKESIYTTKLTRRGIRFVQGRDMDIMQGVMVREVMNHNPIVIRTSAPLAELYQKFQETHFLGFPVVDEHGNLHGIVTLQDMEKKLGEEELSFRELTVGDVTTPDPVTVYADEPIWTAIQKMSPRDLARLPVVSRSNDKTLIGLISRSNILRAYDVGMVRKQRGQMLAEQFALRKEQHNGFIEFRLLGDERAVGTRLSELQFSKNVSVVSIERNGALIIPRGETRFFPGDVVTLFARKEDLEAVKQEFMVRPDKE